jgi:hypothetical protein
MLSALGLISDIAGFITLFFNGNFTRNFNRLNGFEVWSGDEKDGGGMRAIEGDSIWPKVFDYLGFGLIVLGFVLQLVGTITKGGDLWL